MEQEARETEPLSRQQKFVFWGLFGGAFAGAFYYAGLRPLDDIEPQFVQRYPDGSFIKPFKRIQYRLLRQYKNNVDPPEYLMPFLHEGQQQRDQFGHPLPTLLIEPEGILFNTRWSQEKGWHVLKRPFAEYFLAYLSRNYEIVIWASQCHNQGGESQCERALDKLNLMSGGAIPPNDPQAPQNSTRLYRDHLTFDLDGEFTLKLVKDLEFLGRDLKSLVVLDCGSDGVLNGKDNLLVASQWNEEESASDNYKDTYLLDMLPFLETLALSRAPDFRTIIKQYQHVDIPRTFARNVEMAKRQSRQTSTAVVQKDGSGFMGTLAAFFGLNRPHAHPQQQLPVQGKLSDVDAEAAALLQHHSQFANIMENVKSAQAAQFKEAEEAQKEFLHKAGQNLKVTLWDMITKGADVAIRDGLDQEGRLYLDRVSGAEAQQSS